LRNELRRIVRSGRQVWRLIPARHKMALGVASGLMALTSAATTLIPILLGGLVARLETVQRQLNAGDPTASLFAEAMWYLGLLSLVYMSRESLHVIRRYFVENTCTRVERDMTVRVVGHLLKVDLGDFTHEKVGALHGRIIRSVDGFVRFLRLSFLDFFPSILTGVFALAATVSKEPRMALVMAGVIPCSVALTLWQLVSQKNVRLKLLRTREEMDGTVVEQLTGIDYVRAADTIRQEVKRVARSAEKRRAREIRHHFEMSLFGSAKALNEGLFHVLVLSMAIYLAIHGRISFPEILVFSGLFLNVMTPLSEVHRIIDEGHEASLRVGDLLEILAAPADCSFREDADREPDLNVEGPIIAVDDLQVEYTTADGQTRCALDGLDLAIYRGERVGIAGRSGCGKTTWLKVLLRLAHPCGGRVMFGGVPLGRVSREAIGKLVGYVGQNPFVFAGTIEENIAYGVEGATPEAIRRAAEKACIHDEILEMPGGYQAPVAEKGANLSGGQRQRLAIARLFLKNPPILILDEATSALDTISERAVQRAWAALRADRTVILVAHRLSTLLDTDRILVFDDGRIVESGTYDQLVQRGGVFTELLMSAQTPSPSPGAGPAPAPAPVSVPVPAPEPALAAQ
jgi:ATP-binding cassette subfamily B protein